MNTGNEEINIRSLCGEIHAEILMAARHHDIYETLKMGSYSAKIDTVAMDQLTKEQPAGYDAIMEFMMFVMARHCGKTLVNCDEMPVDALPDKRVERFGPDHEEN